MARARARKRSLARGVLLRRWLGVAVIGLVAFLYYRPLMNYLEARRDVERARVEVRALQGQQTRLQKRLDAQTSTETLIHEARRLGYVKPGEQLFVVKGIPEWRQARRDRATTIGGDG